jgi:hypothetical protein
MVPFVVFAVDVSESVPEASLEEATRAVEASSLRVSAAGGWTALVALFGSANPWLSFGFSLWADVFGIMSVTLFWSYINDAFTAEAAKRRFGLIGAAGPLYLASALALGAAFAWRTWRRASTTRPPPRWPSSASRGIPPRSSALCGVIRNRLTG